MGVLTMSETHEGALHRKLLIDLGLFTLGSFAITWLLVGFYILDSETATALFGPMKLGSVIFYIAVAAPSISAFVVTAVRDGRQGVVSLLKSLVRWKAGALWIAISLLGYPLLWLVVTLIRNVGDGLADFDFSPWFVALPLLMLQGQMLRDPGALGEEAGWRGFALPRMLEFMDARAASVVLGLVWAVWHLPAFFVSTLSQSNVDFFMFVVNVIAFSVLMTWIFIHTNGSVLWAGIVPHVLFNATPKAGITPIVWVVVAIAVLILVLGGKHLRGRKGKAVLPQASEYRALEVKS